MLRVQNYNNNEALRLIVFSITIFLTFSGVKSQPLPYDDAIVVFKVNGSVMQYTEAVDSLSSK